MTLNEVIGRGCVFDLETQQKATCEQNSTNCLKCNYDGCNKDDSKLKTNFCIGCNSEDDPNCLKENSNLEIRCLTDQCYTRLVEQEDKYYGRHIERGCLSDLLEVTQCNSQDCRSCSGTNCNKMLFPANRISCKSCRDDSCNGGNVDKICNLYSSDEACLTFYDDDNQVSFRDCNADSAAGLRELCNDHTNLQCTKCEGSLCNVDSRRRGNKCYKCEGLECVNPDLSLEIDCLSECYVGVNNNGEPVRDCADAIINSTSCGVTDSTCLKCDGDHCNAVVHPLENRLTCIKCLNDDCQTLNTVTEFCERWSTSEQCVSVFNQTGVIIERGCSSTIQNALTCSGTNTNCLFCGFDACNVETTTSERFHCVSCNSGVDAKCVSSPNMTQTVACNTDSCYSRLLTADSVGQNIERGCGSDVQTCTGSTCQLCSGERCNSNNFPTDRHSCYFCSGDHCQLGYLNEKQCTLYNQSNKNCVTVYGTGKINFSVLQFKILKLFSTY